MKKVCVQIVSCTPIENCTYSERLEIAYAVITAVEGGTEGSWYSGPR